MTLRRNKDSALTVETAPTTRIELQPISFAESALPLSLGLAAALKAVLVDGLPRRTSRWPYSDRVLAWCSPQLTEDVERFHRHEGPALIRLLTSKQVGNLDRVLSKQLIQAIQAARPMLLTLLADVIEAVREAAGYGGDGTTN